MEKKLSQLDINLAALEELEKIPGIKPEIAARIVEGRPFSRVEDLRKVNGIGRVTLEKLRPLVVAGPPVEPPVEPGAVPPEAPAEAVPAEPAAEVAESAEPELIVPSPAEPHAQLPPEAKTEELKTAEPGAAGDQQPPPVEAAQWIRLPAVSKRPLELREAITYGLLGALAILILGTVLNLVILASINRGLVYARPSQLAEVQRQIGELDSMARDLRSEVTVLRGRVDGLETISGRVGVLEDEAGSLRNDLQAASQKIDGFQGRIDELNNRAAALEGRVGLFERFLSGLRDLMNQTLPQPVE